VVLYRWRRRVSKRSQRGGEHRKAQGYDGQWERGSVRWQGMRIPRPIWETRDLQRKSD